MSGNRVIVVGGGLAGLTAAHSLLQHGCSVLLLDKSAFLGGNSTKATSGINGTPSQAQSAAKIHDSHQLFIEDMNTSFHGGVAGKPVSPIVKDLGRLSGESIDWLIHHFQIDLSVLGLMGGHSAMRTHRGKEKFPGMTITYALTVALEKAEKEDSHRAKILKKARVTRLLRGQEANSPVVGVVYVDKDGKEHTELGPVIITTGGFGADFTESSLLAKYRPELLKFSTTNGDHCTGDGLKMGAAVGAGLVDMEHVQVHPTGLVDPKDPDSKVKFLAAEAIRGTGALMLNAKGERFVNELGRRDHVSNAMLKGNAGPYRLLLNKKASDEILWHCKHYVGRGLMKHFPSGDALAEDMGISPKALQETFKKYNAAAAAGKPDEYDKKTFRNAPFDIKDSFYAALITPVVHYTMGGLKVNEKTHVLDQKTGKAIPGLYCAGEAAGGVHGVNRLGGNSLLDCVVFGRVAGAEAAKHVMLHALGGRSQIRLETLYSHLLPTVKKEGSPTAAAAAATTTASTATAAVAAAGNAPSLKKYTKAEVAKHTAENDCWVIVGDQVLDVTKFMPDHPGGKLAIMKFAGKDATEEFDMLHQREVIEKYAPESVIGVVAE